MGIFDWIILIFIVFFAIKGWIKGFIGMLLQMVGVILIFFLLAHYLPLVKQGLIVKLHLGRTIATILSVILIVAIIALIIQIIRIILEKTLKFMKLSFFNSALGSLVGILTGLLLVIVLSVVIDYFPPLAKTLEHNEKHKVYAAVKVVRSELYTTFKINSNLLKPEKFNKKTIKEH